MNRTLSLLPATEHTPRSQDELTIKTPIFGLRYLEEEDTDIYDVVGCMMGSDPEVGSTWASGCDVDYD